MRLRVIVGCEFSGRVREEFRKRGHDAWSCDLLPCEGDPRWHIQGDILNELQDGRWDIGIFHPPCTYLCSSGMHWTVRGLRDPKLTDDALDFVRKLLNAPIPHIALENPVGAISTRIRKPDCIIHPWQFGHPESKTTCLWLKNLPPLTQTNVCEKPASGRWRNQTSSGQNNLGPSANRWAERSKTYPGIAAAMAEQWSEYVSASRMNASHARAAESPGALFTWNTTPIASASGRQTPKNLATDSKKKTESSTEYVDLEPDPYVLTMAMRLIRTT